MINNIFFAQKVIGCPLVITHRHYLAAAIMLRCLQQSPPRIVYTRNKQPSFFCFVLYFFLTESEHRKSIIGFYMRNKTQNELYQSRKGARFGRGERLGGTHVKACWNPLGNQRLHWVIITCFNYQLNIVLAATVGSKLRWSAHSQWDTAADCRDVITETRGICDSARFPRS